jgi:hypothetical protein
MGESACASGSRQKNCSTELETMLRVWLDPQRPAVSLCTAVRTVSGLYWRGTPPLRQPEKREVWALETLTISVKHIPSRQEQRCAVCGARFLSEEDSGSRVLSMQAPQQEAFAALLCGGCYSKWSHGATVTLRHNIA